MTSRFQRKTFWSALSSALFLWVLVSCGSSSDNTPTVTNSCDSSQTAVTSATFDQLWTNVFAPQCGACHGSGTDTGTVGGPDLRSANSFYQGLVSKKGSDYPDWDTLQKNREGCLDYNFINPSAAGQSLLTAVLDNTTTLNGCTVKYHRDAPQSICITSTNLNALKQWINNGATR